MSISIVSHHRLDVPRAVGWLIAIAGFVAVFATYWDEAWHTDVGRDTAWAAPHVLLYGAVTVVGLGVAAWGIRVLVATRSLRTAMAYPALLAAGLGGLGALTAAPIDAFWHAAYGRDAVLWSPPHMLVVLSSTALVLGVVAGLPGRVRVLRAVTGVLLLANAAAVVFEHEADVPQFSEILYLPLLLGVGLPTVWLVSRVVPVRAPVTTVVLGYAALRLAIVGGLLALGRSSPDLPIAVLGLAAYDLPLRQTSSRLVAAAVATSALAWTASVALIASPVADDVAVTAAPVVVLGLLALLLRSRSGLVGASPVLLLMVWLLTAHPERAEAHDPGQGDPIASVAVAAATDGGGGVVLTVHAQEHCGDLTPNGLLARRAGDTIQGRLDQVGECLFRGELMLPESGRWFVYAEFNHDGAAAETWLPVDASTAGEIEETRSLYRPAGQGEETSLAQLVTGGLVYGLGLALLAVGVRAVRSRRQPY